MASRFEANLCNHVACEMVILLFHSKLRSVLAGKCTTLVALDVLQHATTFPQDVPKSAMQVKCSTRPVFTQLELKGHHL